jgi:hypothetical protein
VDVNANTVTRALDLDARDTSPVELLLEELPDANVLGDEVRVALTLFG